MKQLYLPSKLMALMFLLFALNTTTRAQSCIPAGDELQYGSGNVWRGYVYSGIAFNTYRGYINVGSSGNSNFDHNFGGSQVNFTTNGCPVYSENFSVRFKLTKSFSGENVQFTVGGDDGFRLSIDGGATWLINRWNDQGYTTASAGAYLNGTYNLVLEYYERGGDNRVSFSTVVLCTGTGDPSVFGTNNVWRGYVYQGMNFDAYKGFITKGSVGDANFEENFGGDNVTISGISCPITTQAFSARFKLTKHFPGGSYLFTVGGDDGYRLSVDGGNTWIINRWFDQSYAITSVSLTLSGTHNLVLEYYENTGSNRISFTVSGNLVLPVKLTAFDATPISNDKVRINWSATAQQNFNKFVVQSSTDGSHFNNLGEVKGAPDSITTNHYTFFDRPLAGGKLYYRLAMIDLDGTIKYSPIVTATILHTTTARIFPSLVTNKQVSLESPVAASSATLELYDLNGQRLYSVPMNIGYGRQSLTGELLAGRTKGIYLVRIMSQGSIIASQRIVVP